MCGFYCIVFIEYRIVRKTLLDYTISFFPNDCKKNYKKIFKYFKDKYGKRKCKPWLYTKKIYETRNYLLDEVKHNDLISKKHRALKLTYFEHFTVFVSAVSGGVSISAFATLAGVSIGI